MVFRIRQSELARRSGVWRLFFDAAEYKLVERLNLIKSDERERASMRRLFESCFHPRGIKELAAPSELRMLFAMFNLLDTFESGMEAAERRIAALRSLRGEVIDGATSLEMPHNSARVLLQLTKELIRAEGEFRQLQLARDLRSAMSGRPIFIRKMLRRYFLLEMPESWNQLTFDYHVHDANTKGRKSPTHLIMDAWIKGIRQLQVIYYNFVPVEAASELLQAAAIMEMDVRIGVEYASAWRGRFVELIGSPRHFAGDVQYLKVLQSGRMRAFAAQAREAAAFRTRQVLQVLDIFNHSGLSVLNRDWHIDLAPLSHEDFLASVNYGQPAVEHLAEFIVARMTAALNSSGADPRRIESQLSADLIREKYLDCTPFVRPPEDLEQLPELNRMSPAELSLSLRRMSPDYRITLNLSGLELDDVIEILYDCGGRIGVLELLNLKDESSGRRFDSGGIDEFRRALNSRDVVKLKSIMHRVIDRTAAREQPDRDERLARQEKILRDMEKFIAFYSASPLEARLGSDSSGRSRRYSGMGMVVVDSLPPAARRELKHSGEAGRDVLGVRAEFTRSRVYRPGEEPENESSLRRFRRRLFQDVYYHDVYFCEDFTVLGKGEKGNVAKLGGFYQASPAPALRFALFDWIALFWNCANSRIKNFLKVMAGFIPAFLTFYLTIDWWLLAYGGAFIWLGITGLRNVAQAVLGGGGFKRPRYMRWNEFVSTERVADSLMFTGLSVPLLEYVVKTLLLDRLCGMTAEEDPVTVYSAIAAANGLYIYAHNVWRGFSRTAIVGNVFRPLIATPLAILFSMNLGVVLPFLGVAGAAAVIQQWAAIISKGASDCAAALIEGYADGERNFMLRLLDYRVKLTGLFHRCFALELLHPADGVARVLRSAGDKLEVGRGREYILARELAIDALDLLYFWMYQPRAVMAMRRVAGKLSDDEIRLLELSQQLLRRSGRITVMMTDGLVGRDFEKVLKFYLDTHDDYLRRLGVILAQERGVRGGRKN